MPTTINEDRPGSVDVVIDVDTTALKRSFARAAEASRHLTVALCQVCTHYQRRRGLVLAVAVCQTADHHGIDARALYGRYMLSVHDRHRAGGSLSTRRRTPTETTGPGQSRLTVQRICNGCKEPIGDANEAELAAAVDGHRLPDVTLECGCANRDDAA